MVKVLASFLYPAILMRCFTVCFKRFVSGYRTESAVMLPQ